MEHVYHLINVWNCNNQTVKILYWSFIHTDHLYSCYTLCYTIHHLNVNVLKSWNLFKVVVVVELLFKSKRLGNEQELADSEEEILGACAKPTWPTKRAAAAAAAATTTAATATQQRTSVLNKVSARLSSNMKRKSLERGTPDSKDSSRIGADRKTDSLRKVRKRRSVDRSLHNTAVRILFFSFLCQ